VAVIATWVTEKTIPMDLSPAA